MRRRCLLIVCIAAAGIGAAGAQGRPDFSGSWKLDSYRGNVGPGGGSAAGASAGSAPAAAAGGGAVLGTAGRRPAAMALTVRQTADALVVEETDDSAPRNTSYDLSGDESVNRHGTVTLRTKSRWEDGRLVTEGTTTVSTSQGDVTAAFKDVRWLNEAGAMVIETTREVPGTPARTSRAVYIRAAAISFESPSADRSAPRVEQAAGWRPLRPPGAA